MKIQAILFDFVGVLLFPRQDYIPDPLIEAVDAEIGRVVDDVHFKATIQRQHNLGDAAFDDVLRAIVAKYIPFQPLWELLPRLRKNYRLGIINNGTWLTYPLFNARFDLESTFDVFVSSGREGVRKPNRRIYLLGSKRLGIPAPACLLMDDCLENVLGAEQAGMQGVHWPVHVAGYDRFVQFLTKNEGYPSPFPEM